MTPPPPPPPPHLQARNAWMPQTEFDRHVPMPRPPCFHVFLGVTASGCPPVAIPSLASFWFFFNVWEEGGGGISDISSEHRLMPHRRPLARNRTDDHEMNANGPPLSSRVKNKPRPTGAQRLQPRILSKWMHRYIRSWLHGHGTFSGGSRWAVGGGWGLAIGGWRLLAVGRLGRLVVGGWWLVVPGGCT